jgi:hypothetical protein
LGARDIAGGNVAGFAPGKRETPKKLSQEKAALPTADSAAEPCAPHFIDMAFCAFM